MGDLKGALAVRFNFSLPSFSFPSTQLSKLGLPLPVSLFLWNRGGLVNDKAGRRALLAAAPIVVRANILPHFYTRQHKANRAEQYKDTGKNKEEAYRDRAQ